MIQLLKAEGFDRAKPSTVNAITDLYCHYLKLLITEINTAAQSRLDVDDTIALQDITLAFQKLGITKPYDVLEVYDEDPDLPSDQGMRNFADWCIHNTSSKNARIVALPMADQLKTSTDDKGNSMIPQYIDELQKMDREGSEVFPKTNQDPYARNSISAVGNENMENAEDELIEELIANGDTDDWIRLVMARQRINFAKKVKGKEVLKASNLPPIGGMKYSVLGLPHTLNIGTNDIEPMSHSDTEDNKLKIIQKELLGRLPMTQPDNKIENITLSFENGEYDDDDDEEQELQAKEEINADADIVMEENGEEKNEELTNDSDELIGKFANNNLHDPDRFSLDVDTYTQFTEMEDMENTFQRRQSLDYDENSYDNDFDFNGF